LLGGSVTQGIEMEFRAITPLLVGDWCGKARCSRKGRNTPSSEGIVLRASEIKASSRELFRNAAYQLLGGWRSVLKRELILFGGVDIASPFKIRIQALDYGEDQSFHDEWKKAYGLFIEKVKFNCGKRGKHVTRMFSHLETGKYDKYVLRNSHFSVKLIPRPLVLRRISRELNVDENSILDVYEKSITYSLMLLGIGKRRSRGMGRLIRSDDGEGMGDPSDLLDEYLRSLGKVLGIGTRPSSRLRIKVLIRTMERSEVLFTIYACAKRCRRFSDCPRNCFLFVTRDSQYLVGMPLNFHLFKKGVPD